jgi:hypothetical protein
MRSRLYLGGSEASSLGAIESQVGSSLLADGRRSWSLLVYFRSVFLILSTGRLAGSSIGGASVLNTPIGDSNTISMVTINDSTMGDGEYAD